MEIFRLRNSPSKKILYEKLIEVFEESIIDPQNSFVFGCDYRVPMMHGLLDSRYVREMKMSSTYKDEAFAREYMASWVGASEDSYFNYDRLIKYRKINNPEWQQKIRDGTKDFYLLSVDVARISCQTVCCVFKVSPKENILRASLVNLFVLGRTLETKHFEQQALDLKKIIAAFNPREVVIDANGLGVGLLDFMIKPTMDEHGIIYPPCGVFNDKDYLKIQPSDCNKLIYSLKANGTTTNQIHGNCYTRLNSGLVRFLIKETEAKNKLLSTKIGQKMALEKRVERILPHEMTSKLFDEMANLRIKQTGNASDINLEQINKRYTKDKFSAFEYGLWRIKELEDEINKKWRRKSKNRSLMFYSGGGL